VRGGWRGGFFIKSLDLCVRGGGGEDHFGRTLARARGEGEGVRLWVTRVGVGRELGAWVGIRGLTVLVVEIGEGVFSLGNHDHVAGVRQKRRPRPRKLG